MSTDMHDYVTVERMPWCDLPIPSASSPTDARIGGDDPRWVYVCRRHFRQLHCESGMGRGQILVLKQ